ncbi:hypothetical protein Desku_3174 [Desulfofundulus kuznetsovii DSM 6115]|uniref:Yip1 domain-containing protein n=1 Tax=Desulfofundulus kuznetsovii (strain DSM 6115 / VKM B-1805 / 17) TaxID=760568 RepID=A0AAU8PEZ8_DESK7|nr:hypothetical protein Desku_3174 [Desulfofundulus kuznetsovii DSM 6115]
MSENGQIHYGRLKVLTSPGKAFEAIVEQPAFLKSSLLISGVNFLLALVLVPKIQANVLWMIEQGTIPIPPDQVEMMRAVVPKVTAAGSLISALVIPWGVWLVVAALLKLFSAFSAKSTPFRVLFAVAVYGYIPILIGTITATLIALVVPAENLQQVSLSLASFLPHQKSFIYSFLTQCSPFTWWSLILWGTGGAAAMQIRPGGTVAYLFGCWLLFALLSSALAFWKAPTGIG